VHNILDQSYSMQAQKHDCAAFLTATPTQVHQVSRFYEKVYNSLVLLPESAPDLVHLHNL
jgi:hypothetical protein